MLVTYITKIITSIFLTIVFLQVFSDGKPCLRPPIQVQDDIEIWDEKSNNTSKELENATTSESLELNKTIHNTSLPYSNDMTYYVPWTPPNVSELKPFHFIFWPQPFVPGVFYQPYYYYYYYTPPTTEQNFYHLNNNPDRGSHLNFDPSDTTVIENLELRRHFQTVITPSQHKMKRDVSQQIHDPPSSHRYVPENKYPFQITPFLTQETPRSLTQHADSTQLESQTVQPQFQTPILPSPFLSTLFQPPQERTATIGLRELAAPFLGSNYVPAQRAVTFLNLLYEQLIGYLDLNNLLDFY